jgi:Glyoxalase/Bleomycin resistance protein/Dioxygenase superfamily
MGWEQLVPNLSVPDVGAAQRWDSEVLGFEINWTWEDNFGSVGSENVEIFLYESDEPTHAINSIFVDDVESVYARCREHDAEIVSDLELKPWSVREFSVRDPGGNTLRIGRGEEPVDQVEQVTFGRAE